MDEATLVRAIEPFFSIGDVGKEAGLRLSMAHPLMAQLAGALDARGQRAVDMNVKLQLPINLTALGDTEAPAGRGGYSSFQM